MPPAPSRTRPTATFRGVHRRHAADVVFDELSAAILRGQFEPESALPPERLLADEFGVSRLVLRAAIHRMAEVGLVRVRQGGATIVNDPAEANDVRVIELRYRLGTVSASELKDLAERRSMEGFALVYLAERRAPKEELVRLAAMVDDYVQKGSIDDASFAIIERDAWVGLAKATGNKLYAHQVAWWYRVVEARGGSKFVVPSALRAGFLRELFRRLVEGPDAAKFYLETVVPPILAGALQL